MALRMAALVRRNGHWFSRKGIPEDVRDEDSRLYGVRREAHLKLRGDMRPYEAKIQHAEWKAEIETRIATLRAQRNGDGQPLAKLNAIALAGRWRTRRRREGPDLHREDQRVLPDRVFGSREHPCASYVLRPRKKAMDDETLLRLDVPVRIEVVLWIIP
jgi:hypothetical protein